MKTSQSGVRGRRNQGRTYTCHPPPMRTVAAMSTMTWGRVAVLSLVK